MARGERSARRKARRFEIRIPLTGGTDMSFGFSLRSPRRRRRNRGGARRWATAVLTALCCVVAGCAPTATVLMAPELGRIGALMWPARETSFVIANLSELPRRPVVEARVKLVTAVRDEAPALRAHVVGTG